MHSNKTILTTVALTITMIIAQTSIPSSPLVASRHKRAYHDVCRAEDEQCLAATRMLFDAIDEGDSQSIDKALNDGADVDAISEKYQWLTPLMLAARYDNLSAILVLLLHDADVHASNCRSKTALDEAINGTASAEVIKLLGLATTDHVRLKRLLRRCFAKLNPLNHAPLGLDDIIWEDKSFGYCSSSADGSAVSSYDDRSSDTEPCPTYTVRLSPVSSDAGRSNPYELNN